MSTLLLTSEDLQHVVRQVGIDALMDELIERLTTALREFDPDQTEIPVRSGFHYEHPVTGMIEWMPLLERNHSVLMKTVGYHPESPDLHNMPTILSNLSKYDPATGHLEALLDGTLLTAMRTGAASAVASRVFARPGSATIGLIGCGAQAVTQLHALGRMFPLTEALIYDTDAAAVRSFPARVAPFCSPELSIASSEPEAILARADILCVATSVAIGAGPVFSPGPTRPWLHINAVGSDFPGKTEIPESMLLESIVCPDSL
ncbi:MAG: ornithine cyclodeaminase family protein, partial [Gammaproteobacteria bacterium]|nr:ornithine cyclodeaminase family protein [Gammaproteobacteria bacterium]